MADKHIGALPAASAVYDDSLFVMEQQGEARKASGKQIRQLVGLAGSGNGSGGGGAVGGGYVEMTESIPVSERKVNTLYALILEEI